MSGTAEPSPARGGELLEATRADPGTSRAESLAMRSTSFVLASLALAACHDPDPSNDPKALVGTWRQIPAQFESDTPLDQRAVLTVTDDTFSITDNGNIENTTYTADAKLLTLSGTDGNGQAFTETMSYVVTSDRLLVGAAFPVGSVNGVVGSWHADGTVNGDDITLDIDLKLDNTVHYARAGATAADDETYDGTWQVAVDDVEMSLPVPDGHGGTVTVDVYLKQLPGRALGNPLYERI
jgi:hypothetical protein